MAAEPHWPDPLIREELWRYEDAARVAGHLVIAGLDEVGRGPLAGPVVAGCVVLPPDFSLEGIADSKKLSERQRERADERIRREAVAFSISFVEAEEVDRINILRATHQALRQAFLSLVPVCSPTLALIDGLPIRDFPCPAQQAIVGGDGVCASIAAASIIAKVARDRWMKEQDVLYPEYGFAGHKGYGSAKHLAALRTYGPCPLHRRSFAPVAAVSHSSYADSRP